MNSSKKDISFICDGKESNIITLKPGYMITDVYSFIPVMLDDGKKPIKDIYNCKWVTYMNDSYRVNCKYSLTSTWLARHLDTEITVDVIRLDWAN